MIGYLKEIRSPKQIRMLPANLEIAKINTTNTIDALLPSPVERMSSIPADQRADPYLLLAAEMNDSDTIKKIFLGLFKNSEADYRFFEDIIHSVLLRT